MERYFAIRLDTDDAFEIQKFYRALQSLPEITEIYAVLENVNCHLLIKSESTDASTVNIIGDIPHYKAIEEVGKEFTENFEIAPLD